MNNKAGMSFQVIGEVIMGLWEVHRGKMIGVIVGLVFGILVLALGFWRSIFIGVCMLIGFLVGKLADEKYDFREIMQRIMKNR